MIKLLILKEQELKMCNFAFDYLNYLNYLKSLFIVNFKIS